MELAGCHSAAGARDFKVASRFLKKMCARVLSDLFSWVGILVCFLRGACVSVRYGRKRFRTVGAKETWSAPTLHVGFPYVCSYVLTVCI